MIAPLVQAAQAAAQTAAHDRLMATMFWVGALFVCTPLVIGLSVFGYIWWDRRRRARHRAGDGPGAA